MYLFPCYYSVEVSTRVSEAGVCRIPFTQVSSVQSTQHTVALGDRDLVRLEGYNYWLPWQYIGNKFSICSSLWLLLKHRM